MLRDLTPHIKVIVAIQGRSEYCRRDTQPQNRRDNSPSRVVDRRVAMMPPTRNNRSTRRTASINLCVDGAF